MAEPSSTQQIEYLLQDLKSKSVSVRERAIEELGKLNLANNQHVINALRDVATLDSDKHIKEAAKETLYTLGYELSGAIRKMPPKTERATQEVSVPEYKPSVEITSSFIYCSQCGMKLSRDAKFCYKCGNPVESSMGGTKAKTNVNRGSSNPPKEERDRPKTLPTCAMPGCTYNANRRCDDCGQVFCVEHIRKVRNYFNDTFEFICELCVAKREATAKVADERRKTSDRTWLTILVSVLIGGTLICMLGSYNDNKGLIGIGIVLMLLSGGILKMMSE